MSVVYQNQSQGGNARLFPRHREPLCSDHHGDVYPCGGDDGEYCGGHGGVCGDGDGTFLEGFTMTSLWSNLKRKPNFLPIHTSVQLAFLQKAKITERMRIVS